MKIRIAIVAAALALAACGGGNAREGPSAETAPATEVTAGTDTSMAEETTTTSPTPTTSPSTEPEEESVGDDTKADGQISSPAQLDGAKEDLAGRLDIAPANIEVVTQEEIVWPNGALGCPEPGMMYTQALVDGSLVILDVDGKQYEYHGKVGEPLKYCPDPAPRK